MIEETKSDNTEKKQIPNRIPDEKGRMIFPPGVSGNPAGRPKGSISIKSEIKKRLEEHPEELKEIVEHFIKKNRELMWQMIEGRPQQQIDLEGTITEIKVSDEQYKNIIKRAGENLDTQDTGKEESN